MRAARYCELRKVAGLSPPAYPHGENGSGRIRLLLVGSGGSARRLPMATAHHPRMTHPLTYALMTTRAAELPDILARPAWQARAACRGAGADRYVVETRIRGGRLPAAAEAALATCRRCPVTAECLAYALRTDCVGVWGGTTDAERRGMGGSKVRPADGDPGR